MEDAAESRVGKVKENEKGKGVVVLVMETPDRSKNNQTTTSTNKFEDSPVFDFLNSLSPIEPVKPMHITQTINPLSFASIPSVFTSPHVSSLKRSRFLRRHQLADPSKPEFSTDGGKTIDANELILDASSKSDKSHGNLNPEDSVDEAVCQSSYEYSKLDVELSQSDVYDSRCPHSSLTSSYYLSAKHSTEYGCTSSTFAPFIQEASQKAFYATEENKEGVDQIEQDKEATGCDWESFISNASDILIFESPINTESCKKSAESGESFYANLSNNVQNKISFSAAGSSEQVGEGSGSGIEKLSNQLGEGSELKEIAKTHEIVTGSSTSNQSENMDKEPDSGLHRGVRRRCLVFEMAGTLKKHLDENSASDSYLLMQSDGNTSSGNGQLIPTKDRSDSSKSVLAGIGLHLNALATTPKGYKFVAKFRSPAPQEELINNSSAVNLLERETSTVENGFPPVEDDSQASGCIVNEEITHSSPKKKRSKLEPVGEGEACKRCNCKKSKCLKLYCECFAAGVYCVEPCSCMDCFNKPVHEDTVLATRKQIESRNPLAFAPKVIRSSDSLCETQSDSSKTPASARHKRGCNCRKSGCLKKYCECYQGGVGCSINCRCDGCKNVFGRKDGKEVELEEDGGDITEKSMVDRNSKKTAIQNNLEQNPDSALPATPLQCPGSSVQHPFTSKNKPPRSFPSTRSSFGKTGTFVSQPKFDKHFESVPEDEMPKVGQEGSPNSGIKSSSPNSKRVSSYHSGAETSPELRSSRKLILQSIPSFPSLTPKD
ncbi:Hypothetical predicted protein [Olea europaea subsp. europaea]|uniref:CRC domain-containing protein n=2 Tax=Olea europaea subsp. europaea TaxID=158383 RepID=A0A8S0PT98_OLEEU|nr:Hypothetical predicted protein [Olea europaea subsp. europaea]